ncbi:ABC transporter ATP-binding protein [Salisediminibacterium selenitireducens]|uniref:Quaternary amine transport ATP-binding protein n=1 Tax=Bacillus selenitireducens (strain ATCC 700615 / DSM 15326 / MLS10) TaxID=439292 RepID=D6XUD5_BACIE|nr:ABC transporter ATP-binding protein [Salisediminibacterium selenitireducens]ADH99421.1 ABC transporter related protein [[Bacillus] selenitireducens MLS10]
MIRFDGISKTYPDGTTALNDVSFTIEEGEFFVLIGPSGSGKTTAMKLINRLIDPSSGSIYLDDRSIHDMTLKDLRGRIGYVLQQIALFPHMTIEENIRIVPDLKKWPNEKTEQRVTELMTMVGLDPSIYRKRMPKELSGGQQQRVGVIRALAGNPDIILMDEPFSALDPISREQLQKDIAKLQKEIKKTIVFVTHDMDEALALGERIAIMKDGSPVQVDTPEQLLNHPANAFVADFLGDRKTPWLDKVEQIWDRLERAKTENSVTHDSSVTLHEVYAVLKDENLDELPVRHGDEIRLISRDTILAHLEEAHIAQSGNGVKS